MSNAETLAPYACRPQDSRGRLAAETESPSRSCHQRDRDRVIHSGAFRKLKYKTQVFVFHEGDYYRTRLSHSLEVAQIARSLARTLTLNEDLVEAVALAHDLGHTPFGHAGEDALHQAMAPYGGFSHNDQALRVLTVLERRYAEFDGLNLTWETLEGVVKHNGPLLPLANGACLPVTIGWFQERWDLRLDSYPGAEAQVAALADDIAYTSHDLDDGLRAGLFPLEDAAQLPMVGVILNQVRARYPGLERPRLIHETIRRLVNHMVTDLVTETRRRIADAAPKNADEFRAAGRALVGFSETVRVEVDALRAFLFQRMYRHFRVNRLTSKAKRVVRELFHQLHGEPNCLPTEWQEELRLSGGWDQDNMRARMVADYIAGMTDRYAFLEHRRLFDPYERG